MKPVKSFRIEQELLDLAEKHNLDVGKLLRASIAKAVKDKRCPYCGATNGKHNTKIVNL